MSGTVPADFNAAMAMMQDPIIKFFFHTMTVEFFSFFMEAVYAMVF